ncbi:NUDIX domain-containing protein [bacterium]|nr:NUDIX domain-containing protein [bacterium]
MAKREFSAGGIVIKREKSKIKVLLIKDGYGKWTWPKGNIDKGESSEDAALRETNEETGLKKLRIIEEIDRINYFYRLHGTLIYKTVYLFLMAAKGREKFKIQTSEIQDAKWFIPEEALETVAYKGSKEILKKAIERARKRL